MVSASNRIVERKILAPFIAMFVVETPRIARKAKPDKFVMLRIDEKGVQIPTTKPDCDGRRR